MKKTLTITLTSKEAIELLTHPATGKKIHTKIIAAFRDGNVYPKGALTAAVAARKPAKDKEPKPAKAAEKSATQ